MSLVHCERCRFNFESAEVQPSCPQCGGEAVLATQAERPERDAAKTLELRLVPPPGVGK